jgi:hypothetical protein
MGFPDDITDDLRSLVPTSPDPRRWNRDSSIAVGLTGVAAIFLGVAFARWMGGRMSERDDFEITDDTGPDWASRVASYMGPVADAAGVDGLRVMAVYQAHSESKGNNLVGLGIPSRFPPWAKPNTRASAKLQNAEATAAEIGYDRNAKTYSKSPYPRSRWVFGSGGYFGLLPSTALAFLRGKPQASSPDFDPWDVFDPHRSCVAYADFVRRITRLGQWKDLPPSERNWLAVKRAGASLTTLTDWKAEGDRAKAIHAGFAKRLASIGVPASFARQIVPPFRSDFSALNLWNDAPRQVPTGKP